MRSKEYLAAIRARDGHLLLETMYFPDEIRDAKKTVAGLPVSVKVEKKDLDLANRLIEGLTSKWQPTKYRDTYRERVLKLVKRKQRGEDIVVETAEKEETSEDLMEALRASVEAIKKKRSGSKSGRRKRARAS
jgi:DNA end-binding protein Ku